MQQSLPEHILDAGPQYRFAPRHGEVVQGARLARRLVDPRKVGIPGDGDDVGIVLKAQLHRRVDVPDAVLGGDDRDIRRPASKRRFSVGYDAHTDIGPAKHGADVQTVELEGIDRRDDPDLPVQKDFDDLASGDAQPEDDCRKRFVGAVGHCITLLRRGSIPARPSPRGGGRCGP